MTEVQHKYTIKFGAGYDAPWATLEGTYREVEVEAERIIEGTLPELIAEVSQRMQGAFLLIGKSTATGGVGAKTMKDTRAKAKTTKATEAAPDTTTYPAGGAYSGDSDAGDIEEAPVEDPVITAINAATTKAELGDIWAKNQKALKDPALMDVMKARSASLAQK